MARDIACAREMVFGVPRARHPSPARIYNRVADVLIIFFKTFRMFWFCAIIYIRDVSMRRYGSRVWHFWKRIHFFFLRNTHIYGSQHTHIYMFNAFASGTRLVRLVRIMANSRRHYARTVKRSVKKHALLHLRQAAKKTTFNKTNIRPKTSKLIFEKQLISIWFYMQFPWRKLNNFLIDPFNIHIYSFQENVCSIIYARKITQEENDTSSN